MMQIAIVIVSVLMVVASISSFAGKMQMTKDKTLSGVPAIVAGIALLAGAVLAVFFALFILPML